MRLSLGSPVLGIAKPETSSVHTTLSKALTCRIIFYIVESIKED